jgi:DNA mismatch repair ATPase MutS
MKAYLMYPDRDFDPQQVLSRRERELNSRNPNQSLDLAPLLPPNAAALIQDLGLQILFSAMANGDNFLSEAAKVAVLSGADDPQIIRYRQRILTDCLRHQTIVRELYQISLDAITAERKNYWSSLARYPSGTLHRAVEVLQMFVGKLRSMRRIADECAGGFESDGFSRLFATLKAELGDDYFASVEHHLSRLKFRDGVLISAGLGQGNKGAGYVLRRPHQDQTNWIVRLFRKPPGYTFRLHPRDEAGARALSGLRDQGVNLVANALAQSTDHILSFFQMLRTELAFYVGCLNLMRQLVEMDEPTCWPIPAPHGERKLSFSGLYDVCLALSKGHKVVGNELNADGKDLLIITGANNGGKSTFLRSIGLGQLMMQAGMFVPAENFSAEVCDRLFTHYRREEDTSMRSGKLDEELSRMSDLVDIVTPRSMVLFNESFAATNEREGSEIARQVATALLETGVRISFVTHLHEFARVLYDRKMPNAIFLRAERLAEGTRTFQIKLGEPLQTSYGKDLYERVFGPDPAKPIEKRRAFSGG